MQSIVALCFTATAEKLLTLGSEKTDAANSRFRIIALEVIIDGFIWDLCFNVLGPGVTEFSQ